MASHQPVNIVMIEDDEGHARLIEKNIRRAGISNLVKHFTDGHSALSFLYDSPEGPAQNGPALILLDLNLPKLNGLEVLDRILDLWRSGVPLSGSSAGAMAGSSPFGWSVRVPTAPRSCRAKPTSSR